MAAFMAIICFYVHKRITIYGMHTKVENDTLINEDGARKVVFCTFSYLLKAFYM